MSAFICRDGSIYTILALSPSRPLERNSTRSASASRRSRR